jgi:hypothetical protein
MSTNPGTPEPPAPGWYPTDRPYRFRYFDGAEWIPGTIKIEKTNHTAHAIATLATCGVWAPFWWIAWSRRTKDGFPVNFGSAY